MNMLRNKFINQIKDAFAINQVCALLGPRQCGKTTLSQQYAKISKEEIHIFDLEDPLDLAKLENARLAFESLNGLIIIDEVQRRPELFPILRVMVDKYKKRFLILGSASRELIKQSSESLAGRISYIEVTPFALTEVEDANKLWVHGGYPRSFLAKNLKQSLDWRKAYIKTFLEQDLRNLGFDVSPETMRRFWVMLAHYHGQLFNASEIARSLQITSKTADRYLDILAGAFMVRRLSPWYENIKKRQVKSPKLYLRDTGLFHFLIGITDNLLQHPKLGASWEGFAIEEIIRFLSTDNESCYFWGSQAGAELDLLILDGDKKIGFEFKYTDSPKITKSMHIALEDLKLDELNIIIPLKTKFHLSEKITVYGLESFLKNEYRSCKTEK